MCTNTNVHMTYIHTWRTCHTRQACQCDTWRQIMCTWSHRITNYAPIQTSLFAHMTNLTFNVHILHITMPWSNSRRLKMNSLTVKIIRPADASCKEMLHCTCMSTARTSAYMCVYCVSSTYIYLLCSVKRDASVQCACILYNHACMHFTKCFGCAVVSWCPVYPVHVVWQWCTAAAGGVKLVVCAIVHNRNAVVCPCLCTVEASHFCVWMCLSYFSSIMRCSTKKGPHFHQHYFHHRRHRTSSTVDLHVSFVQFAALHSFCIS